MPSRMTTPHSLLLHALFAVFWVLLLDALRLRALGCPLSPHQYGVSFGCLVAGTLDNSGFHLVQTSGLSRGWLTRHAPELGQFLPCDKLTLGHRCCPYCGKLSLFPLPSCLLRRSLIDLSCLVWLPNCLFGAFASVCPQLGQSYSVARLMPYFRDLLRLESFALNSTFLGWFVS